MEFRKILIVIISFVIGFLLHRLLVNYNIIEGQSKSPSPSPCIPTVIEDREQLQTLIENAYSINDKNWYCKK